MSFILRQGPMRNKKSGYSPPGTPSIILLAGSCIRPGKCFRSTISGLMEYYSRAQFFMAMNAR